MTALQFHYQNQSTTQKRSIRQQIIERCNITHATLLNWLNRKHAPPLAQEIISEVTGIEKNKLYKSITINN